MQSKFTVITSGASENTKKVSIHEEVERIKRMEISHVDPATVRDGKYARGSGTSMGAGRP